MAEIKIKCPKCGRNYALTAPNPGVLVNKQFTCKRCGNTELFGKLFANAGVSVTACSPIHQNGGNAPVLPPTGGLKTHIGGSLQESGLHTQIGTAGAGVNHGMTQVAVNKPIGTLEVQDGGKTFRFGQGIYVLGRDSSDSNASIKLAGDPYMSRQHAKLSAANAGGIPTCLLTCVSQANPIYINGQKINNGVPTPLRDGDKILLGMTTVFFKLL